jgi:hypothetical protein
MLALTRGVAHWSAAQKVAAGHCNPINLNLKCWCWLGGAALNCSPKSGFRSLLSNQFQSQMLVPSRWSPTGTEVHWTVSYLGLARSVYSYIYTVHDCMFRDVPAKITAYTYGWPEPYICTVYDRIFGNLPAKNTVCTPYIYGSGQPYMYTVHDHMFGDVPARITAYTLYRYGSGQP